MRKGCFDAQDMLMHHPLVPVLRPLVRYLVTPGPFPGFCWCQVFLRKRERVSRETYTMKTPKHYGVI